MLAINEAARSGPSRMNAGGAGGLGRSGGVRARSSTPAIAGFVEAIRTSLERGWRPARLTDGRPRLRAHHARRPELGTLLYRHQLAGARTRWGGDPYRPAPAARPPRGAGAPALCPQPADARGGIIGRATRRRSLQSFPALEHGAGPEEFRRRALDGRVEALARPRTWLAARRWRSLREVIEAELAALREPGRYSLAGPDILLR